MLSFEIGGRCPPGALNGQSPNNPLQGPERVKRVEVYWHAVSYKQFIAYVLIVAAIIFAAVGALVFGASLFFSRGARALTNQDVIVLADFANTTGEPVFEPIGAA